jgi:hypothetical protein
MKQEKAVLNNTQWNDRLNKYGKSSGNKILLAKLSISTGKSHKQVIASED